MYLKSCLLGSVVHVTLTGFQKGPETLFFDSDFPCGTYIGMVMAEL